MITDDSKFAIGYRYNLYQTDDKIQNNVKINLVIANVKYKQITSNFILYFCYDKDATKKIDMLIKRCNNEQEIKNKDIIWLKNKLLGSYNEASVYGKYIWEQIINDHNDKISTEFINNLDTSNLNKTNWV